MTNKTESKTMDRYEGAMIGVAIGDALGAPLEFCGARQILAEHGEPVREMIGGGWLSVEPGEVTDDTQSHEQAGDSSSRWGEFSEMVRNAPERRRRNVCSRSGRDEPQRPGLRGRLEKSGA